MKPQKQKKPENKPGRPRKVEAFEWPIYDTMAQCASMAGVPLAVLKQAKSLGCPAFKHSRVYFGEFLPWLFANLMDDSNTDWGNEMKKAQALRERIKLAEDEERVVERGAVTDGIAKALGFMFGELDRVFISELPARGKGMDELKLRKLSKEEIEKLKATLTNQFTALADGSKSS